MVVIHNYEFRELKMTIGIVLYCDAGARQTGGKPANPGFVGLKELNEEYALMVASKLLNIEYASLLKLNTSDFFTVSRTISSFLMKGE